MGFSSRTGDDAVGRALSTARGRRRSRSLWRERWGTAVVAPGLAEASLEALRSVEGGEEAEIIGEIREEPARMVIMHTGFGGTRMIDMLVGDPLPRIC